MGRKPSHDTVTFKFEEPVDVDQLDIGPDGKITMMAGSNVLTPLHTWSGRHRDRTKGGEKQLYSIPMQGPPALTDEATLLARYSFFFVIDTNTIVLAGETVSVASIATCSMRPDATASNQLLLTVAHVAAYEFRGLARDQERLAWVLLQDAITRSPDFDPTAAYLIVSDHALRSHSAINERSAPLFGDRMLAPGLSVGFATSDSGASIAQKILRDCDRNAGAILRDLKAGLITERGLRSTLGAPVSQFRGYYNTRLKQIGEPPPHLRFRLATDTPFLDLH